MFQVMSELTAETLFVGGYEECEEFITNHRDVDDVFAFYIEEE
jgi:hypothetical protein